MKSIADVIKYEGENNTFIWKHPSEDFNSLTQLIVHENQEAVFFMNGEALDLFGPGRYTLETQNIPKIGKFLKRTADENPFHCEVYFINKSVQMAVKWGTDSRIRFIEPTTGIPLDIGASGELNLQVSDSRKLLVKLVGTTNGINWDTTPDGFTKSLQASFRPLISTAVKAYLISVIKNEQIDLLEIDERLEILSESLRLKILPGFEEYGLFIPQMYVTTIALPEDDLNFKRFRDLHTISFQTKLAEAEATVRTAQAVAEASITAAERKIELERQATLTEVEKREAERVIIEAQAEAQAKRIAGLTEAELISAQGLAEAEVMRAKGYTEKDVLQADVQKAYAAGIGSLGGGGYNGSGVGDSEGNSGAGGIMSDVLGLGIGLAAAGTLGSQMSDVLKGFGNVPPINDTKTMPQTTLCPKCGNILPENAKFCLECGTKIEHLSDNEIICPSCGMKTYKGKFCMECGFSFVRKCPSCGEEVPVNGKFCLNCGEKL